MAFYKNVQFRRDEAMFWEKLKPQLNHCSRLYQESLQGNTISSWKLICEERNIIVKEANRLTLRLRDPWLTHKEAQNIFRWAHIAEHQKQLTAFKGDSSEDIALIKQLKCMAELMAYRLRSI